MTPHCQVGGGELLQKGFCALDVYGIVREFKRISDEPVCDGDTRAPDFNKGREDILNF